MYIYKPIGKTCSQMLEQIDEPKKAFSGRLDPMAHGQMIVLINEQVKNEAYYHKLSKIYKFSFVIGFSTGTDDILGFIDSDKNSLNDINKIVECINNFPNSYEQDYHKYSSFMPKKKFTDNKRKPLWWWSNENIIVDEKCSKNVKLYSKEVNNIECVSKYELQNEIINKLKLMTAPGFKTEEIIKQFENYDFKEEYTKITCTFKVSSGFYVRQFVRDLNKLLNVDLIVTDINRLVYCD